MQLKMSNSRPQRPGKITSDLHDVSPIVSTMNKDVVCDLHRECESERGNGREDVGWFRAVVNVSGKWEQKLRSPPANKESALCKKKQGKQRNGGTGKLLLNLVSSTTTTTSTYKKIQDAMWRITTIFSYLLFFYSPSPPQLLSTF